MAVRTIATDIRLSGEKEFNDQMKAVNSNLGVLKSEMSAVSSEFGANANSAEALRAKQRVLNDTVAQQKEKVAALRDHLESVKEAYGDDSAMADRYKKELNNAIVAEKKAAEAAEKNKEALKALSPSIENSVKGYVNLVNNLGKGAEKIKAFDENFKKIGEAAQIVGRPLVNAGNRVKNLVGGVGKLAAASVGAATALASLGVVGISKMADFAKDAAEAAKAAAEAGEPLTESQQKWLAFSDQLGNLDAAAQSAKAALGGVLLPALGDLSEVGAQFLQDFSRDMEAASGNTEKQGQVMAEYIGKGAKLIKQKLPEYIAVGKELLQGLGEGLADEGPELLDMMFDLLMDLLDGIIDYAPQMADGAMKLVDSLIQGLIEKGPDLLTSAVRMVTDLVRGLAQAAPDMIPAAANLVVTLITALVEAAPDLLLAGLELIYGIISGIMDGLGNIADAAGDIINTAKEAFSEKASEILSIGDNIVKGIWEGISNGTQWIYDKISGWVGDVLAWIKEKLGISSPSRVTKREIGFWMARGVGSGFVEEMRNVNREIADSIDTSFDIPSFGPKRPTGRYYATRQGNVINLYFTAKQITQADIEMICDTINRKLGDAI